MERLHITLCAITTDHFNYGDFLLLISFSLHLLCLFFTEWPPSSLLLCWPAHPAPPQVLWGGGVWCGSRPDAPQPATLHPSVSTSGGCSPSHTARYAWVISHILLRIQLIPTASEMVSLCLCTVCVQPPGVRGRDAVRIMPSVMEGQGEPYFCLVCWHWLSGLEVHCVYLHRSLDTKLICCSDLFITVLNARIVYSRLCFLCHCGSFTF